MKEPEQNNEGKALVKVVCRHEKKLVVDQFGNKIIICLVQIAKPDTRISKYAVGVNLKTGEMVNTYGLRVFDKEYDAKVYFGTCKTFSVYNGAEEQAETPKVPEREIKERPVQKKITDDELEKMMRADMTQAEIARKLGMASSTISVRANRLSKEKSIPIKRSQCAPKKISDNHILKLANEGNSQRKIAEILGIHRTTVKDHMEKIKKKGAVMEKKDENTKKPDAIVVLDPEANAINQIIYAFKTLDGVTKRRILVWALSRFTNMGVLK